MKPQHLPVIIIGLSILTLLFAGPVAQLDNYHAFADQVSWRGINHVGDVLSNIGFAIVGIIGLVVVSARKNQPEFQFSHTGWQLFCAGLILTAAGSTWYHLAPDNFRLIFDRLPIALACAGLLAAVRSENVPDAQCGRDTIWLGLFAITSVAWWALTDLRGDGDLRPYLLLQAAPLVLIPLWQAIYKAPRRERLVMANAIALYVAAKIFELSDHQVAELTGFVSGHSLKHLLATAAGAAIVVQLYRRGTQSGRHQAAATISSNASASNMRSDSVL